MVKLSLWGGEFMMERPEILGIDRRKITEAWSAQSITTRGERKTKDEIWR
jgi:hypothetical protein